MGWGLGMATQKLRCWDLGLTDSLGSHFCTLLRCGSLFSRDKDKGLRKRGDYLGCSSIISVNIKMHFLFHTRRRRKEDRKKT